MTPETLQTQLRQRLNEDADNFRYQTGQGISDQCAYWLTVGKIHGIQWALDTLDEILKATYDDETLMEMKENAD